MAADPRLLPPRLLPILYCSIAQAALVLAFAAIAADARAVAGFCQYVVFGLWSVGVPALAAGLAMDVVSVVRLAGWCLLAAAILDAAQTVNILNYAYVAGNRTLSASK